MLRWFPENTLEAFIEYKYNYADFGISILALDIKISEEIGYWYGGDININESLSVHVSCTSNLRKAWSIDHVAFHNITYCCILMNDWKWEKEHQNSGHILLLPLSCRIHEPIINIQSYSVCFRHFNFQVATSVAICLLLGIKLENSGMSINLNWSCLSYVLLCAAIYSFDTR